MFLKLEFSFPQETLVGSTWRRRNKAIHGGEQDRQQKRKLALFSH